MKRIEFSIPTWLPADADMFIRCAEETRGNLLKEWKKRKKERRKRADISAFLPVKRDTLQPVEGGGKKGSGKKIDDNDDK